jgi:hypothetical protein
MSGWELGLARGDIYTQGTMQGARRFHSTLLCCQGVFPWSRFHGFYHGDLELMHGTGKRKFGE